MGIIFRWKRCFQGQRRCPVGVFCQFKRWVLNLFLEGKHSSWETGESRIFPDILLQRQSLDSRGDNPRARCLPPLLHAPSDSWARVRLSRRSSGHSPSTAPEIRQLVETWIGTWQLFGSLQPLHLTFLYVSVLLWRADLLPASMAFTYMCTVNSHKTLIIMVIV